MKKIIGTVIAIIAGLYLLSNIIFPLQVTETMVDVIEGDERATEELTDLMVEETVDTVKSEIIWAILGAFGITSVAGLMAKIKGALR
ncbi:MAG: hypothetical protein IAX21_11355 [Candidatus Bathyarchaeota archaeon]|nr:MAG: hypothetical protein NUK63_06245 [Candidatus Bathyarchaeum tardum]WNZ29206.1 MAG: hypothetical protein IAX21_11355 [Candidatus Bathyarchaeota archaeon]